MPAVTIIQSESISINSLDDLTTVCKYLASVRHKDGAALVQCAQFLPPNPSFPESTTKFHKPKTVSFLKTSRANSHRQEFLQIDPFKRHRKVTYQQPDRMNAPEGILTPEQLCNTIELVSKNTMKSQTRLVIDSEHCENALLKAGPPLSEYNTPITGVTTPMGLVSIGKSVFEVILGDWGLGWSSLLVCGASAIFVIIAPDSTTVFESAIEMAFGIKRRTCSQFLRHYGIFPSLSFLHHHNIEFSLMQQRGGDVAIIFPGTYCYGIETGTNYSETISWATDDWNPTQVEYKICNRTCGAGDVLERPRKRRCNQPSSVQRTTVDPPHIVAASRETSDLGPDAVSSSQLSEAEQSCPEATSSEEFEVGEKPVRQRTMSPPSESPSTERVVAKTPESTRILNQRTRRVLTNDVPTTFPNGYVSELLPDDELHRRVEEYLDRSEREGSAKLKESVNVIRRHWARLRSEQAQTRHLLDG